MASFTPKQQRAIQEKVDLFREIAERGFSCDREHSVRTAIYRKRQGWLEENFEQVSRNLQDYPSAVEKAFRLVFLEYMKINPDGVGTEFLPSRRGAKAVYIRSRNFCPYLEAFRQLGLRPDDSVRYCEMSLAESMTSLANAFLAREGFRYGVWFGRNYYDHSDLLALGQDGGGIRPIVPECQEYFIDDSLRFLDPVEFRAYEEMCKSNLRVGYEDARKIAQWWR